MENLLNKKTIGIIAISAIALSVVIIADVAFIGTGEVTNGVQRQNIAVAASSVNINNSTPTSQAGLMTSSPSNGSNLLPDVFQRVENSVVQITTTKSNPNDVIIVNGIPETGKSKALGSGFVYDNQGHIITNFHVIDGANNADVTFTDGNTYSAKVIGKDSFSDLAVLQITDNFSEEKVIPLVMANSSDLRTAEQVAAIGNPFGLSGTITTGIISQLGRLLPNPDTGFSIPNTIQTDAAINPGNSGGPLLNMNGQVIGMNTAIFSGTGSFSGIGFAIPSNTIAKEVPSLIKDGTYVHPSLGISGGKITPELAKAAGLPANYKGIVVGTVQPNSPAEQAGIKGVTQDDTGTTNLGDLIIAVDGHSTRQIDDLINYIESNKNVGDPIKLTISRDGKIMDLTATLQARPQTNPPSASSQDQTPPSLGPIPELPQFPGFPQLPPLLP